MILSCNTAFGVLSSCLFNGLILYFTLMLDMRPIQMDTRERMEENKGSVTSCCTI